MVKITPRARDPQPRKHLRMPQWPLDGLSQLQLQLILATNVRPLDVRALDHHLLHGARHHLIEPVMNVRQTHQRLAGHTAFDRVQRRFRHQIRQIRGDEAVAIVRNALNFLVAQRVLHKLQLLPEHLRSGHWIGHGNVNLDIQPPKSPYGQIHVVHIAGRCDQEQSARLRLRMDLIQNG